MLRRPVGLLPSVGARALRDAESVGAVAQGGWAEPPGGEGAATGREGEGEGLQPGSPLVQVQAFPVPEDWVEGSAAAPLAQAMAVPVVAATMLQMPMAGVPWGCVVAGAEAAPTALASCQEMLTERLQERQVVVWQTWHVASHSAAYRC